MSETPSLRNQSEPSARVWQATDILKLNAAGFVRSAWSGKSVPAFNVQTIKAWEQPLTAEAAEALRQQDELQALAGPGEGLQEGAEPADQAEPEALESLTADALKAVQDAAYADGLAEGERRVREAWDADIQSRRDSSQSLWLALDEAVRAVIQSPAQIHDPLKRLALHLAEQLVLAELSLSPQAIERLVRRAVDELAAVRQAPVLVELHPDDLAMLKTGTALADALAAERPWQLLANDKLIPGSVKVSANDAVLVDLIENRLEALARSLLLDPSRGMAQSAFKPARMASRQASVQPVQDAQARMAPAWKPPAEPVTLEPEAAALEAEPAPEIPPEPADDLNPKDPSDV